VRKAPTVYENPSAAPEVARSNPDATITEAGHSLGGYEAQVALTYLVDQNIDPSATAVTFQAPGLSADAFHHSATSYNVLNLYDQGDAIRLAGGTHLGTSASLAAAPSPTQEFADGLLGIAAGELLGGLSHHQ
jgi:hypothetical protein